jgi:cytochrome c nitrite reductase small subunit
MTSPQLTTRSTLAAIAILVLGIAVGVGLFTFVYAKGYSYLGHDAAACNNCHAMNAQYAGWMRGSHRRAAQCADCHTPFNLAGKYAVKAWDGFWHSYYFTTNTYPDNIEITALGRRVAEGQCRACHQAIVANMAAHGGREGEASCIRCHASVGHL